MFRKRHAHTTATCECDTTICDTSCAHRAAKIHRARHDAWIALNGGGRR